MKKKIVILIIILALVLVVSVGTIVITTINRNSKPEELSNFSWETKLFTVNDDYSYTFLCLVTIQEINGIETIKYQKDGEEVVLNGNGKQKISIDFNAIEDKDYEFKITPTGEAEKTKTLRVKRKVSGDNTYELVGGVYMNTPFLENFNDKYTRYLIPKEGDTLTPGDWIYGNKPENWYNYKEQKWANIYVEAGGVECYYVWIPRYVYKIKNDSLTPPGNERMDVKFVDVYNNYTDPTTKQVTKYKDLVTQGYKLPEAFDFGDGNDDNGLLMVSLSGYWISKYQLSELEGFKLDYNMAASRTSIVLSNYTNKVQETAKKYTFALNGEIKDTKESLEEYTFKELKENESYIVNVTALDENDTILASMTKILEPTEVNEPKLEGFDPDTTFYVYWDENGIEHNEIPISTGKPPKNWYNYTYSEWANIVTRNDGLETYYVWVPRYQYMLNQTSQRADVKFILGTGTETTEGYQIPDAFWWDINDNGQKDEGEQLTGYWITKYQLSREESEARITAELAAGTDCIHVKDITGTLLKTKDDDGNDTDVPITYTYYLNGESKGTGTDSLQHFTFDKLDSEKEYTVNIIATNTNTGAYIGAITKKVTTQSVNKPDLASFLKNETQYEKDGKLTKSLKERTYYVVYDDNNNEISNYVPISNGEPQNWYDYSKSRWANIVITDGNVDGATITDATTTSYFVWVPRYEYRILQSINDWSNLSTANARTDVKFISGTDTKTSPGYQIPDAFWWDKNDDGNKDDDEQLPGYWISKYQLTDANGNN